MDNFAAEKEAAQAQLSSAESQLQNMKEKGSIQAERIEELEARLASELAKAESDTEQAKANADTFVAVYWDDAEAAQAQAREAAETANTRAHWIKRAKELKTDAEALASDDDDDGRKSGSLSGEEPDGDDDDDDGRKSGSLSGKEPDGEETAPGDNQET
ncbi:eukaryotic translation initiation factor 3 subunit C-like [Nicotiana tomentosiformis]|uniref:eukaryotic translation initiation factor 3 subunit C-like n=1 Tax=Nicotiana tomentosiformis TaxID=4098 RepID=UPI00388C8F8B